MVGSNDSLIWPGPPRVPGGKDTLRAELQALAEFIQDRKHHAERRLGPLESGRSEHDQDERNRPEDDRRFMREAFDRWKKSNEEYDRRWEESQARSEEMQREIKRRLDALEGRSREEESEEGKPEGEGTSDG
jgi:hypothetical protein